MSKSFLIIFQPILWIVYTLTPHGTGVYPQSAGGVPFTASAIAVKGDPITDLYEDLAAEQKARSTYEYLIDLSDDPEVTDVLRFLRAREIVHFQRFGEALRTVQEKLAQKKFYMGNMPGDILGVMNNNDKHDDDCISLGENDNDSNCGCNKRG